MLNRFSHTAKRCSASLSPLLPRLQQASPLAGVGARTEHSAASQEPIKQPKTRDWPQKRTPSTRRYALKGRDDVTNGHERPSQRPYGVSLKVSRLLRDGNLKEAIDMVKGAPLSSQNSVVWRQLCKAAFVKGDPNLAYSLFQDMKKRGFHPDFRGYAIMFYGFKRLPVVSRKQEERIKNLWDEYKSYVEKVKEEYEGDEMPQYYDAVYVHYIAFLAPRGEFGAIDDIFSSMPEDGPFSASKYVIATYLASIGRMKNKPNGVSAFPREKATARATELVQKLRLEDGFDTASLKSVLDTLINGSKTERDLAYNLVTEKVADLGDPKAITSPSTLLSPELFQTVLRVCNSSHHYEEAVKTFLSLRASKLQDILHRTHLFEAIRGLSMLAPSSHALSLSSQSSDVPQTTPPYAKQAVEFLEWAIREAHIQKKPELVPSREDYVVALLTARRCNDWSSGLRMFELATGLDATEFQRLPSGKKAVPSSNRPHVDMDSQMLTYLTQAALNREDKDAMKTCIRIFRHYGSSHFFHEDQKRRGSSPPPKYPESNKYFAFHLAKSLQSAVLRSMDTLTPFERPRYLALNVELKKYKLAAQSDKPSSQTAS